MIKILVAEDEKNSSEAICTMLEQYIPEAEIVAVCKGVNEAVTAIHKTNPDILLLDVELLDGNGFDLLKQFPKPSFKTIFITGYQKYAVEAFRFAALDYLLKPIDPQLLTEAIRKAGDQLDIERIGIKISTFLNNMDHLQKGLKKIILKTSDNIHVVNVNDIVYCEADRSYTTFFFNDQSRIIVSRTLGEYEELFSEYGFFRIHSSYLINLSCIKRFEKADGGTIILNGNIRLPVATRKKESLLKLLSGL